MFGPGPRTLPNSLCGKKRAARKIIEKMQTGSAFIMETQNDVDVIKSLAPDDLKECFYTEKVSNGYLIYFNEPGHGVD